MRDSINYGAGKVARFRDEYKQRLTQVIEKCQKIINEAEQEANKMIASAREEKEHTIREAWRGIGQQAAKDTAGPGKRKAEQVATEFKEETGRRAQDEQAARTIKEEQMREQTKKPKGRQSGRRSWPKLWLRDG